MHPFNKRLTILASSALAASVLLGLYAPSPTTLVVGIIVIGLGMVLGLLYYLLRPLPQEMLPMFDGETGGGANLSPPPAATAHQEPMPNNVVHLTVIRGEEDR